MAKGIKDLKGSFDFVGRLKSVAKVEAKEAGKNGKLDIVIEDKGFSSEVTIQVWEGSQGAYYSNVNNKVEYIDNNIETEMNKLKATAKGVPFSLKIKTPKGEKEFYTNNEFISSMLAIKGEHNVRAVGEVTFRTYNGRVFKDYKLKSIEFVTAKEKHGFILKVPVAIAQEVKGDFVFADYFKTVPVLVNATLEDKTKGYRAIDLGLDCKELLGGVPYKLAKDNNKDVVELINEKAMPMLTKQMNDIKGYVIGYAIGRLKAGNITKKPTIEDINPMERTILEEFGDENSIKNKLDSMDIIQEYFDNMYLHSFDFIKGKFFEAIDAKSLNLPSDDSAPASDSNAMLNVFEGMMNDSLDEIKAEVPETKKEENLASSDELDLLVSEAEAGVTPESNNKEEEDTDVFPF